MKLNIKELGYTLLLMALVTAGTVFQSCEDEPDKFEIAGGKPEVLYVRLPDIEKADSLLIGAYMDNAICLVGNNLRSITELFFNDQKAILNTSFITDHTLIVNVPKTIPEKVDDKIFMVTSAKDTVEYDFKVLVPSPVVSSISCEYAQDGQLATIYGDYLLDDEKVPLKITMAGNLPVTDIVEITKNAVTFRIPEGSDKGYITVTSIYGSTRSAFQFRDDRILFDCETPPGNGWRTGNVQGSDPAGIDGNYLIFKGDLDGESGQTWNEDAFSFNYWAPTAASPDLFDSEDFENMLLKFEINVTEAWKACALQVIFTSANDVSLENGNNGYITDDSLPRALWRPWEETGTYITNGWRTISIPLSDFKYTATGASSTGKLAAGRFSGLTFFVYSGGINGESCSPVICIDNIRVVPAE